MRPGLIIEAAIVEKQHLFRARLTPGARAGRVVGVCEVDEHQVVAVAEGGQELPGDDAVRAGEQDREFGHGLLSTGEPVSARSSLSVSWGREAEHARALIRAGERDRLRLHVARP